VYLHILRSNFWTKSIIFFRLFSRWRKKNLSNFLQLESWQTERTVSIFCFVNERPEVTFFFAGFSVTSKLCKKVTKVVKITQNWSCQWKIFSNVLKYCRVDRSGKHCYVDFYAVAKFRPVWSHWPQSTYCYASFVPLCLFLCLCEQVLVSLVCLFLFYFYIDIMHHFSFSFFLFSFCL
jgi:hypothetical protein